MEIHKKPGRPTPLGASLTRTGVNFAVFSPQAEAVRLAIFDEGGHQLTALDLDPTENRTGSIWHLEAILPDTASTYGYQVAGPWDPAKGCRFDADLVLLDPYAKALSGGGKWGERGDIRCQLPKPDEDFDWEGDRPPGTPLSETLIYELNVRGYTANRNADVKRAGTYAGLTEKIPHLKELGITAVELLPIAEFNENELDSQNPETGEKVKNVWGYSTLAFFAPKAALAASGESGGQVREFKEMVKAFHQAGIEVILDVVFNHTSEGGKEGDTSSFRGLADGTYYFVDHEGEYVDFSGCGNSVNCNHPVVADLIVDCLRHWVSEMHVDGFRFDLASVLTRGQDGEPLPSPPVIERIAFDPLLGKTKLLAEAWDAAGLYQIGTFPSYGRWCELNGKFRDDVRGFFKGDEGSATGMATRMAGSSDLYESSGRRPYHSINFVTCHDGYTLRDLVSYQEKHNLENGEENQDGSWQNESWNTGAEGPTDDPEIEMLRHRRQKSFLATLFLAQGVPFLLAGDEFGRTKKGNNNTYCQDNETGWIDWSLLETNRDLFEFTRNLIAFRKSHPNLRRCSFLRGKKKGLKPKEDPDVVWLSPDGTPTTWENPYPVLGQLLTATTGNENDLLILMNGGFEEQPFHLQHQPGRPWKCAIDSSLRHPEDIRKTGKEIDLIEPTLYVLHAFSVVVLTRRGNHGALPR